MTHFQINLMAKVTETVTVEADTVEEATELARRHSKLSRFSYADPRNTQWDGADARPLLTRDDLTNALAVGGH